MLRDSYRLLVPGGLTAFLTIHLAPGLTPAAVSDAIEAGPPAVAGPDDYVATLAEIGFTDILAVDVTDDYRRTLQAWFDGWDANLDDLERLLGSAAVRERQRDRRQTGRAIDAGLLRRTLVAASRPRAPQSPPTTG